MDTQNKFLKKWIGLTEPGFKFYIKTTNNVNVLSASIVNNCIVMVQVVNELGNQ